LIIQNIRTISIWERRGKRRDWIDRLYRASDFGSNYFKTLYPQIVQDLKVSYIVECGVKLKYIEPVAVDTL